MIASASLSWRTYAEWRLGRVELTTDGSPLTVQVLSETGDEPIGESFELAKRVVLTLPDGDYRLRLSGVGRLGRTYRFAVNRGETQSHNLSLDEGRLLGGEWHTPLPNGKRPMEEPIPMAPMTIALELTPGKADLVEWSGSSVIRRDGVTGKVVWDTRHPAQPFDRGRDPSGWITAFGGRPAIEIGVVEPAADLDGDGTADIVWTFRGMPSFLALSGKDGSVLWAHTADPDGPGAAQFDGPVFVGPEYPKLRPGSIVGTPVVFDVDRDGTRDLIATAIFGESAEDTAEREKAEARRGAVQNKMMLFRIVVLAVSGRSGRRLWSYSLNPTFTVISSDAYRQPAALLPTCGSTLVAAVGDSQWFGLDAATGRLRAGPVELGFVPVRAVQHADFDGDGEPEILALGARHRTATTAAGCVLVPHTSGVVVDEGRPAVLAAGRESDIA